MQNLTPKNLATSSSVENLFENSFSRGRYYFFSTIGEQREVRRESTVPVDRPSSRRAPYYARSEWSGVLTAEDRVRKH